LPQWSINGSIHRYEFVAMRSKHANEVGCLAKRLKVSSVCLIGGENIAAARIARHAVISISADMRIYRSVAAAACD
jgi:hypothetical protein